MTQAVSKHGQSNHVRLLPQLFGPRDTALKAMAANPALVDQARSCALSLRAEMDSRDQGRAALAIERLASHYPRMERDGVASQFWADDWLEDTGHLPPCVVEEACAEWRRSPERFMPTPGQLLEKAERIHGHRLAELRRAEDLAAADLSEVQDEREVSEEDRKAMKAKLQALWKEVRA